MIKLLGFRNSKELIQFNFQRALIMKPLLCIIFSFFLFQSAAAQAIRKSIDFNMQAGWIIPHNAELQAISQTTPLGLNLRYQVMNSSRENWEACNCFHYLGLGLQVHDFQNSRELGRALTLYGSFQPILWKRNSWELALDMGIGASYLTRVYDEIENPRNTFFSAPISFLLFVRPVLAYSLSDQVQINTSFYYNHISNGGQRQPNRGMNYPMFSIGMQYFLSNQSFPSHTKTKIENRLNTYLELGVNSRSSASGGRQPNFTLGLGVYQQVASVSALGIGLDLNKDFSLEVEQNRLEALMPAPFIAHHFLFGRFDFQQRFAWYAKKPADYQAGKNFYQRYTLMYQLGEKFRLGVGMKAHGHVAENMDLRLGWKF